jgi:hypothetical protein
MSNKQVTITHPDFGDGTCMQSAVAVWLAKGWTLKEAGAEVEQAAVTGEVPQPKAPSVSRLSVTTDPGRTTQN